MNDKDERYSHGYEGDCDICGKPANRRWEWLDGYAEDRCSEHWVSERLPERGEHAGIARITRWQEDEVDELRDLERWIIAQQQEADEKSREHRESNPAISRNQYIRSTVLAEVWGEVTRRIAEQAQTDEEDSLEYRDYHVPRVGG
jgi:hypothetical protein